MSSKSSEYLTPTIGIERRTLLTAPYGKHLVDCSLMKVEESSLRYVGAAFALEDFESVSQLNFIIKNTSNSI